MHFDDLKNSSDIHSVLTEPSACYAYGFDNSKRHGQPQAVVFPTTLSGVQQVVHYARQHQLPIVCRGRGTGTPGGAVPHQGGIVLSTAHLNQIIDFSPENRTITAQTGVLNGDIQAHVADHNLFWAPDPSSAAFCTIGGNLAYNSAGPRAIKYGTVRENTLALTAVDGRGEIIQAGAQTPKSVVGYDLTRLLIGSEGTLGIIVSATLKLLPAPKHKVTLRAFYRSTASAAEAVLNIMQSPIVPCALEMMDAQALHLIRKHHDVPLPDEAHGFLIIEVDSVVDDLAYATQEMMHRAQHAGLIDCTLAKTEAEQKALWATRKALSPTLRHAAPHKINEDVVVPLTQIAALVRFTEQLAHEKDIIILNFGHAGSGNLHVNILYDKARQQAVADACLAAIFDEVIRLGGSLSGEHGVGLDKRAFIDREINPSTLRLMKDLKGVFDPMDLLNPGKMF